jgi:Ca-activated chloride channel family protein
MTRPGFSLTVSQNEYLSTDDKEMHAVLTVTGHGLGAVLDGRPPEAAEVITIDCSGSMGYPPTKIAAARRATAAAIDALREGVYFAVVEGTHTARMAYPVKQHMVAASPETRNAAKSVVKRLQSNGGTAMGTWLSLAGALLDTHPTAVRHVMFLTDGKNETETRQELDAVLAACEGKFVCDARGIGEDWIPAELLRIVSALHGSADAVREDAELVGDFTAMMQAAMSKVVPDLRLRISTAPFTRLRFVKQTFPVEADLTEFGTPIDARTTEFSTGSWGEESREYHLCFEVDRGDLALEEDIQAARVDLAVVRAGSQDAEAHGKAEAIRVHWTTDRGLSSVDDPNVAHYAKQAEMNQAVTAGCDAYDARKLDRAAAQWGRAVALASELGNEKVLARLLRLVDIQDNDIVRVRANLSPRDILAVAMSSQMSTVSPQSADRPNVPDAVPAGPDRTCSQCGYVALTGAVFCPRCGTQFEESV